MLSHRNIAANTTSIVQYLGLGATDRVLSILPLLYCYGRYCRKRTFGSAARFSLTIASCIRAGSCTLSRKNAAPVLRVPSDV